jgi:hypothetical protein
MPRKIKLTHSSLFEADTPMNPIQVISEKANRKNRILTSYSLALPTSKVLINPLVSMKYSSAVFRIETGTYAKIPDAKPTKATDT